MGQQYLIDSNVVIDYLDGKLPSPGMAFLNNVVDAIPNISVITKIEVLGYNLPPLHYKQLSDFAGVAIIFDLSDDIVNETIRLKKIIKIKTPDAIIAATCLVFNFSLITRNEKDFTNIAGPSIINPWTIK